jgi:prevent-host-death family protein
MFKTISARSARNNFSSMLDKTLDNSKIIITRFNRPTAVITSFKSFNPQETMSAADWKQGFDQIKQLRKKTTKLSQTKVDSLVEEVLQEK